MLKGRKKSKLQQSDANSIHMILNKSRKLFPSLTIRSIILICLAIFTIYCKSDGQKGKSAEGYWFRGNTHTHAQFSDTNDTNDVPMIAGWYEAAGYDFLCLSEHNDHIIKKKIFCHDEAARPPAFIMLCGNELSETRHHTALGINSFIGGETSLQDGVTKTLAAGGVPILNHPQDPVVTASAFIATNGLNHMEVFNGGRPEDTPATERLWDSILTSTAGRMVYAVAADDNHYKKANVGRGWIMVKAPALTKTNILDNIRAGNFYATTGVILNDYNVASRKITVDTQNGDTIKFIGKNGSVLKAENGNKATYQIQGNELYIRIKITNAEGKAAWTQPIFVASYLTENL
jgi:hypothetical protein